MIGLFHFRRFECGVASFAAMILKSLLCIAVLIVSAWRIALLSCYFIKIPSLDSTF